MKRYIGCSGYYYNHWRKLFYPESLPKKKWLEYYSKYFNTVEINNTFYKMPDEKVVKNWYSITPADFIFAIKGFRFFTHLKKLKIDNAFVDQLNLFQHNTGFLKEKTGPLLWQFPQNFNADTEKLNKFCSLLSVSFYHVFEFRNATWYNPEVYSILRKYNHDLCIVSGPSGFPGIIRISSKNAYVRFHGEGSWYDDNYSEESLNRWKEELSGIKVVNLYAYFNNDMNAYAVNNARYFASIF